MVQAAAAPPGDAAWGKGIMTDDKGTQLNGAWPGLWDREGDVIVRGIRVPEKGRPIHGATLLTLYAGAHAYPGSKLLARSWSAN